jgi:hypothetical protein
MLVRVEYDRKAIEFTADEDTDWTPLAIEASRKLIDRRDDAEHPLLTAYSGWYRQGENSFYANLAVPVVLEPKSVGDWRLIGRATVTIEDD